MSSGVLRVCTFRPGTVDRFIHLFLRHAAREQGQEKESMGGPVCSLAPEQGNRRTMSETKTPGDRSSVKDSKCCREADQGMNCTHEVG
jgi:hypothetical protein